MNRLELFYFMLQTQVIIWDLQNDISKAVMCLDGIQNENVQTMIRQGQEPIAQMVLEYAAFFYNGGSMPFWYQVS